MKTCETWWIGSDFDEKSINLEVVSFENRREEEEEEEGFKSYIQCAWILLFGKIPSRF